jgi:hypothetical protein
MPDAAANIINLAASTVDPHKGRVLGWCLRAAGRDARARDNWIQMRGAPLPVNLGEVTTSLGNGKDL